MLDYTRDKSLIICIGDLIVQRSIMKKSPKKKIRKPTPKQLEKMSNKKFVQLIDRLDKQR